MAVLKYKNANGEYIPIPAGIPSNISVFENDAGYQSGEGVNQIIDERIGYGLRVNDGMIEVEQWDLFVNDNSYFPAWAEIGGTMDFNGAMEWALETEENAAEWVSNVVVDKPNLQLAMEFEDGGCSGWCGVEPVENGTAANGNTFSWLWDMTAALGEDTNAQYGISKIEIGYAADANQFSIILSLGDNTLGHSLQYVSFGIEDRMTGLAHYYVDNYDKWQVEDRNGTLFIDLSDDYIISLINDRLSSIGVAEEGVF